MPLDRTIAEIESKNQVRKRAKSTSAPTPEPTPHICCLCGFSHDNCCGLYERDCPPVYLKAAAERDADPHDRSEKH